jgi:hypothetical protein
MPPFPLPATMHAVYDAALLVQAEWVRAAQSSAYIGTNTGAYVRGIQMPESLVYPANDNPLSAWVVNVARHASAVEYGHPSFHLPSVIRWGQTRASRRTKKGSWVIYVPFRHTTPRTEAGITPLAQRQMMPTAVYRVARTLQPGQRITTGPTRGRTVHAPGLTPYQPRTAVNIRPGYRHASRYEGMRRQGAKGHTRYITFRAITPQSPGWTIPAQPGTHIAQRVALTTAGDVARMIEAAFLQDVEAAVRQSLGGKYTSDTRSIRSTRSRFL